MASIINTSVNADTSADIVLTNGQAAVISLRAVGGGQVPSGCSAFIDIKNSDGTYGPVPKGELGPSNHAVRLVAAGTYRVRKLASTSPFGVDQV